MSQQIAPIIAQIGRTNATSALTVTTRPKQVGNGNARGDQRSGAKRPALLNVRRQYDGPSAGAAGLVEGTIQVFTALLGMLSGTRADLPQTTDQARADGVQTSFQTGIPYVAFSNNNWLVRKKSDRPVAITGTVTKVAASTAVVGAGTAFTTEVVAGQTILIGGEYRIVSSITDNTHLTVSLAFVSAAAGATAYLQVDGKTGLTGTVAVTANSAAVTGTGTKFTKEIGAGDDIIIAGITYTVDSVDSDTALTLQQSVAASNAQARAFGHSDLFLTYAASPTDANDFSVTSGLGGNALITFPAAPSLYSAFEFYFVVPTEILAPGVHMIERTQVLGGDVYWAVGQGDATTYDLSAAVVSLEPAFTI